MFRICADTSAGDWIRASLGRWGSVAGLVPSGYPAYCRVLHPPDPGPGSSEDTWGRTAALLGTEIRPGVSFEEMVERAAPVGRPDLKAHQVGPDGLNDVLPAITRMLTRFTGSDKPVYVALWEGWGDLGHLNASPRLTVPHRAYYLYSGGIDDLTTTPWMEGTDHESQSAARLVATRPHSAPGPQPADDPRSADRALAYRALADPLSLAWPEGRQWFLGADTDLDCTYIGGPRELIEALIADPALEVLPASPDDPL